MSEMWTETNLASFDASLERIGECIVRSDAQWLWESIDSRVRETVTERLAEILPDVDPSTYWALMEIRHRREIIWNLSRSPEQRRAVWEEQRHRLQAQADEETVAAFTELVQVSLDAHMRMR